jgi:hypothetical protein
LYSDTGDYQKASNYFTRGIASLNDSKIFPSMINIFEVAQARERVLHGDHNVRVEELMAYRKSIRFKAFHGLVTRHIGEILLHLGDRHLVDAEHWLHDAVRVDTENGMRWFVGGHHRVLAELHRRNGDEAKAADSLQTAINTFKDCGARSWATRIERQWSHETTGLHPV